MGDEILIISNLLLEISQRDLACLNNGDCAIRFLNKDLFMLKRAHTSSMVLVQFRCYNFGVTILAPYSYLHVIRSLYSQMNAMLSLRRLEPVEGMARQETKKPNNTCIRRYIIVKF